MTSDSISKEDFPIKNKIFYLKSITLPIELFETEIWKNILKNIFCSTMITILDYCKHLTYVKIYPNGRLKELWMEYSVWMIIKYLKKII